MDVLAKKVPISAIFSTNAQLRTACETLVMLVPFQNIIEKAQEHINQSLKSTSGGSTCILLTARMLISGQILMTELTRLCISLLFNRYEPLFEGTERFTIKDEWTRMKAYIQKKQSGKKWKHAFEVVWYTGLITFSARTN